MNGARQTALKAALAGLFAMAAAMGIGRFVYTPILPLMIAAGTLDASEAGLVAGSNFLGYLIGALAASAPMFQSKARLMVYLGLSASIVSTAAMGLDTTLPMMIVIRFVSGLASAFAMIFITASVMAILAENNLPGLVALHFGGVGLGIAASAAIVGTLAALGLPWQPIWFVAAAACAFAFAATHLLLPVSRATGVGTASIGSEGFGLPLALLTIGYGFFGFGYVGTATFINAMAKSDPLLEPVEPFIWAIVGLAGLPSLWLWNKLSANTGPFVAYVAACCVEAAAVMLSVLVRSPAALMISAILFGGTFMAITALGFSRARTMKGGHGAKALALMTAAFGLGQMIGPVVAGLLYEWRGDLFLASMLAGVALLIAAMLAIAAEVADRSIKRQP